MAAPEKLHIDFETCSELDLKKVGVYRYAEHPSTRVLCLGWAWDDDDPMCWSPFPGIHHKNNLSNVISPAVLAWIENGKPVHAWHAAFEWVIWNYVLVRQLYGGKPLLKRLTRFPSLQIKQMRCSMAQGLYWGVPGKLEDAALALNVSHQKNMPGHKLMLQMSRPRHVDKKTGEVTWWHETDPMRLRTLCDYCMDDVDAERDVSNELPPLPDDEQSLWQLDLEINTRGVMIDNDLVTRLSLLSFAETTKLNKSLEQATRGKVKKTSQNKVLLEWVHSVYPESKQYLPNLQKQTLNDFLDGKSGAPAHLAPARAMDALRLRQEAAKTSVAKLSAMERSACHDGAVRGTMQYYGAQRTGRWAGRLLQLQNMPRGVISNVDLAIKVIKQGRVNLLPDFFGSPLDVASSCLRGCLVPRRDKTFYVFDFEQIEARVICWLCGQLDVLAVFARGDDVYAYTAEQIGSGSRQLGKVLVLGCGFGTGPAKFKEVAAGYGIVLTDQEAHDAVYAWRNNNYQIVKFWGALGRHIEHVLLHPRVQTGQKDLGFWVDVNKYLQITVRKGHLLIKLPSERVLIYRDAAIRPNPKKGGEPDISYMGVDQYTRKWTRIWSWGGKFVENVVQAIARDIMALATVEVSNRASHLVDILFLVHDEMVCEGDRDRRQKQKTFDTVKAILETPVKWAPGLPVAADGWIGDRYRK